MTFLTMTFLALTGTLSDQLFIGIHPNKTLTALGNIQIMAKFCYIHKDLFVRI